MANEKIPDIASLIRAKLASLLRRLPGTSPGMTRFSEQPTVDDKKIRRAVKARRIHQNQ
jgi:hypothetical protein